MEVRVDVVILTGGDWAAKRDNGEWVYACNARITPYAADEEGQLQPVEGPRLAFLTLTGYEPAVTGELRFPAAENGGSPDAQTVALAQVQWLGQRLAEYQAEWNGRVMTAEKRAVEEGE